MYMHARVLHQHTIQGTCTSGVHVRVHVHVHCVFLTFQKSLYATGLMGEKERLLSELSATHSKVHIHVTVLGLPLIRVHTIYMH